jgi:hypothetical protein
MTMTTTDGARGGAEIYFNFPSSTGETFKLLKIIPSTTTYNSVLIILCVR